MMLKFLLLLILSMVFLCKVTSNEVFGSPAFPREQFDNKIKHVVQIQNNSKVSNVTDSDPLTAIMDISAVNYFSDGKLFNATLWLLSPLFNNTGFYNKTLNNTDLNYGMSIDADFNNDTGIGGADYGVIIHWDHNHKSWSEVTEEFSPYDNAKGSGSLRTLNEIDRYKGFFENGKSYVHISMNLNKIASPDHYRVMFYTEEIRNSTGRLTSYAHYTQWVNIPPPKLTLTPLLSPSQIPMSLRPGEQKNIDVQINATKPFETVVRLTAKSQNSSSPANLTFKPRNLNISSDGIGTAALNIAIPPGTAIPPGLPSLDYFYTLSADASFSSIPITSKTSKVSLILPFYGKLLGGTWSIPVDTVSVPSHANSYLTVTIQKPLTLTEQFTSFWTAFGGIVSLIGGGFAAGFSALVFDRLRKSRTTNSTN